ncbi:hypothetical protein [Argonema galeatum]|uniref:hypothetical protein n=1 Tax=Argonema galeatum TaxID=2942762 RepID=UPI002012E946|nr:hypothetical protein [Argonema galeatum]MCL1466341.1 hypothetical protein [Argonema galeatum A003/A1]
MKEERQNAYYQLIEALLNCPSGEEAEILQAHPDLQDAGLVQAMLEVADNLRREGSLNNV